MCLMKLSLQGYFLSSSGNGNYVTLFCLNMRKIIVYVARSGKNISSNVASLDILVHDVEKGVLHEFKDFPNFFSRFSVDLNKKLWLKIIKNVMGTKNTCRRQSVTSFGSLAPFSINLYPKVIFWRQF